MIISGYLSCLFRLTVSKWNIVCSKNCFTETQALFHSTIIFETLKFRFKTTYPRVNKLTIITLNTLLTSLTSSSFFLFPTFFSLVQRETDHERGRRARNQGTKFETKQKNWKIYNFLLAGRCWPRQGRFLST